jgi:hypothetical protein
MSRDIKAKMGIPARFGSFEKLIPRVLFTISPYDGIPLEHTRCNYPPLNAAYT